MPVFNGLPICKMVAPSSLPAAAQICTRCNKAKSQHHGVAHLCFSDRELAEMASAPEFSISDATLSFCGSTEQVLQCEQTVLANHHTHGFCSGLSRDYNCQNCSKPKGYHIPSHQDDNNIVYLCDVFGVRDENLKSTYHPIGEKREHNEAYLPLVVFKGMLCYFVGIYCPIHGEIERHSEPITSKELAQAQLRSGTWTKAGQHTAHNQPQHSDPGLV